MAGSLVLVAFSFLFCSSLAENPGFAVRLTNHGLEHIRDLALDLLQNEIKHVTIPSQNGETGNFLGKVKYSVSSIQVQSANVRSLAIRFVPNIGIRVTGSISLQVTANWWYKARALFFSFSDSGTLSFRMTDHLSITGSSKMGYDQRPTASVVDCRIDVTDVDIHFRGGASWLYNLFSGTVERKIEKIIESQACARIKQTMNREGHKAMQNMRLLLGIGRGMQLDLRLVSSPVFKSSYLQSPQKGQFIYQGVPLSDFSPAPLHVPENLRSKMFYLFITEAMLNSGSAAYLQSRQLELAIKPSMVPFNDFFKLDTNTIGTLLPGSTLRWQYPNMGMQLNVSVPNAPKFNVSNDSIRSVIPADVEAFVIQPDGNLTHVFTLGLMLNTTLSLWVEHLNGLLHAGLSRNLTVIHGDVIIKETNVGQFSVEVIEAILNLAVPALIAGIDNKGIPLPTTPGLTFIDPEISVVEGSIVIGTDVKFKLPPPRHSESPSFRGHAPSLRGHGKAQVLH